VPSVAPESFGLVAAEAILNGIPVIASDRGALAEVVGDDGECLAIPASFTPESRIAPTADEVRLWVEAVQRRWDQPTFHAENQAATGSRWYLDSVAHWEAILAMRIWIARDAEPLVGQQIQHHG